MSIFFKPGKFKIRKLLIILPNSSDMEFTAILHKIIIITVKN